MYVHRFGRQEDNVISECVPRVFGSSWVPRLYKAPRERINNELKPKRRPYKERKHTHCSCAPFIRFRFFPSTAPPVRTNSKCLWVCECPFFRCTPHFTLKQMRFDASWRWQGLRFWSAQESSASHESHHTFFISPKNRRTAKTFRTF